MWNTSKKHRVKARVLKPGILISLRTDREEFGIHVQYLNYNSERRGTSFTWRYFAARPRDQTSISRADSGGRTQTTAVEDRALTAQTTRQQRRYILKNKKIKGFVFMLDVREFKLIQIQSRQSRRMLWSMTAAHFLDLPVAAVLSNNLTESSFRNSAIISD